MTQRQILAWRPIVLATLLLQAACSESAEPEPGGAGTIRIAIQTHGQPGDLDPDGYEVLRAGSVALEVPTNGEALLEDIPAGAHALSLAGLAPNCAVDIGPADPVTVTADDTVLAGWLVTCGYRPTSLTISFATPPDAAAGELTIRLNGQSPEPLRAGQAVTFDGLAHGGQSVTIGHSPNCRIEGPASRVLILRSAEEATLEIRGTCSAGRLLFDSNKRLWMLNADGSGLSEVRVPVNQITGLAVDRPIAETPALSRDGQHLAITVGGRGLYALDWTIGAGGGYWNLPYFFFGGALVSGWNARDAKWSPDGTQLAFSNIVDSSLDIFVINADGSNLRQVTNYDRSEILPSWSPDGSRIAFQGFMDGTDWIHAVNTDGTDRVALNPGWRPSWAPDGAHIAFVRITGELALVNPDDGQVRVIAGAPHHMSSLAWSPDARMIAGFAPGAGIIMVDLAGGVTHLTVDGIPVDDPSISWVE